jgi:hypothetical protein
MNMNILLNLLMFSLQFIVPDIRLPGESKDRPIQYPEYGAGHTVLFIYLFHSLFVVAVVLKQCISGAQCDPCTATIF